MENNYYICAIIKNEQLYLKEWIEYHLSLGFNYIYLFEDFESDSHYDITKEFADKVILTKCKNYFTIKRDYDNGGSRQRRVYSKFLYEHYRMGWCAFIDIDEFIVFNDGYTLDKICSEYNDAAGICMFWKMFNANEHITRPTGNVFKNYTEETGYLAQDLGWCYKSLVNMNIAKRFNNQHMISGLIDVNRNKIKEKDKNLNVCFDKIQLNHYYTKSVEDWLYRFKNKGDLVINHRKFNSFYYQNPDLLWISDYIDETSDISDLKNKSTWQYNEDILITIGMPNYNGEKYIREAIDSCLNQTYKNFELLIVDDGSTDNSINIIESYNDPRIRLIKNSHDFIDTRNKILNLAKGKYIALLDSDDIMNPDRLEYQIKYMENNQSVDMCYTQCESANGIYDFELYDRDILKPITYKEMLSNNYIFQNTVMIRKSTIEKYNLQYDKEFIYIEDYKLWLDMLSYNCIIMELPKKIVKYRVHNNNCTVTKKDIIDKKKKELIEFIKNDNYKKLNIGCQNNLLPGWINTDIDISFGAIYMDATKKINYPNNYFDYIYSEHMFEHLTLDEGFNMLTEIYRTLKNNGIFRLVLPLKEFLDKIYNEPEKYQSYIKNHFMLFDKNSIIQTPCIMINNFYRLWEHKTLYDKISLYELIYKAGFTEIIECELNKSNHIELCNLESHENNLTKNMNIIESYVFEIKK